MACLKKMGMLLPTSSRRFGSCVVFGAGDATGSAVCRRFAEEGFNVCAVRRLVTISIKNHKYLELRDSDKVWK